MDTFLSYAIPLCAALAGLSSFFDAWSKISERPVFEGRPWIRTAFLAKTWFKLTYFLTLAALSFLLGKCKSDIAETKSNGEIARREAAHTKHEDSIQTEYKKDIRSNNDSNIHTFTKSLQEYHLSYDSGQKRVYNKMDSLARENPGYSISAYSRQGSINTLTDSLEFPGLEVNTGNCPVILNFKVYVGQILNGKLFCSDSHTGRHNYTMAQGVSSRSPLSCHYTVLPSKVYFLYIGSYSNRKKSIINPIDEILEWTLNDNSVGLPANPDYKDSIENAMKRDLHLK